MLKFCAEIRMQILEFVSGARYLVTMLVARLVCACVSLTHSIGVSQKYDQSLFQRLERAGHRINMLSVQYRMHPAISAFPSQALEYAHARLPQKRTHTATITLIHSLKRHTRKHGLLTPHTHLIKSASCDNHTCICNRLCGLPSEYRL